MESPNRESFYVLREIKNKELRKIIFNCSRSSGPAIVEACALSFEPDLVEIDKELKSAGWSDYAGARDNLVSDVAWCKKYWMIDVHYGDRGWVITFKSDINFKCG
ncbi:hypothetical protein [Janthinobacterium aquaticum]|uniref:hypothetical protein n=1 Tax=Janthinobacterium sp. FT58W TaxID=2654254 RepID=UPI00126524B1|nr:hypothetical protein [Janthinobacterium sp. FT58W]KAB8044628.1 hypothetical protein GCM43_05390 [Janthinobacterium sp. FT58W]